MSADLKSSQPSKPRHLGCGGSLVAYQHYAVAMEHPLVWDDIKREWTYNPNKVLMRTEPEDAEADTAIACYKCRERVYDNITELV